ncbi:MAG: type 4a pilus biogenesis protein PilO [Candidatus Omnitrophica bacterium]|nr:type 4a pilus biogenesis protein PilO [Candidatus Omnitrophota bacterium]
MFYKSYQVKTGIVSLAIVLFTLIAGMNFIYQPAKKRIKKIEDAQKIEKEKNSLLKEISVAQKNIQKHRLRLFPSKDTSYLLNQVTKLANESNVKITSITPKPFVQEKHYQKLSLVLVLETSYNQLGQFISKLESSYYFISVGKIIANKKGRSGKSSTEDTDASQAIKINVDLQVDLFCKSH